jgi:DNA adenine methylase
MTGLLSPLYMWAGGKTRLIKHYEKVWPADDHLEYVEPFFGGGAVFGWRLAQRGPVATHIGDVNTELMGVLALIKDDPETFVNGVTRLARQFISLDTKEARKNWYYTQREIYWQRPTTVRLYVLMRTGFNGIWQTCVASGGLFGTPAGLLGQTSVEQIINPSQVRQWSLALQSATLHGGSYEHMQQPSNRALIYLDPPYRGSFTTYGTSFTDEDQKRLAGWFRDRAGEGHRVVLANRCVGDDVFFEDLIGDVADFHYFDVTYTAGRRKQVGNSFEAKAAREFIAISR